jgi:hypothetical protein
MLPTDEFLIFVKIAMRGAFRLENKEEYDTQYNALFESLKKPYEKRSDEIRIWLY